MPQLTDRPVVAIGQQNTLRVIRQREVGVFLDGGVFGSILLPQRYVAEGCQEGDLVDVFVYLDSEDQMIATTEQPDLMVGQFGCLKVAELSPVGAFLDWGLPKDLLLPFSEQRHPAEEGKRYLVRVYLDNTNRIAATTKLDKFLDLQSADYRRHQKVELIIAERTELGYKAIINQSHWGLIHHQDLFQSLTFGQSISGFIKQQRPDGKIDILLEEPGYAPVGDLTEQVLQRLEKAGGFLPLSDRSSPELISAEFGVSKKKFKMAIGSLYKQRQIEISPDGIRLVSVAP
ncbi:MAG: S1-like domain-containing RNA-binding protein [Halopseudomonas sp.]